MASCDLQAVNLAVRRLGFAELGDCALLRSVPMEAQVSNEVCGIGYAVMMAMPPLRNPLAVLYGKESHARHPHRG